jgi:hypothetical protein
MTRFEALEAVADADADAILSALTAAGYVILQAEMSAEQAARSMAGHALADRVRDINPAEFARWIEMRRATWRQMVVVMKESGAE